MKPGKLNRDCRGRCAAARVRCQPADTGGRKRQPATVAAGRTPMRSGPTRTFAASPAERAGAADHEDELERHAVDLEADQPQQDDPPDAHPDIKAEVCRGRGEDPGEKSMAEKVSDEGCTEDAKEGTDHPRGWRPRDPTWMALEEYMRFAGTCAEMGGVYRTDAVLKTFPHSHLLHHQENACIFAY